MLSARTVLSADGVAIADVACRHEHGRGEDIEPAPGRMIVFVRRGAFVRSADGVETLLDPTRAYIVNPGVEQRFDHPHAHGDDCTAIGLDAALAASLLGGDPALPGDVIATTPDVDLEHRLLLAAIRSGVDTDDVVERARALRARVLARADARRVDAGRPRTAQARRALADGAREALAEDGGRSLPALARELAVSPHHLSRVFHQQTGETISRHRMRLRARGALERLAAGETDLARLAADLGFADQSHLTRVLRSETGRTPSTLRTEFGQMSRLDIFPA